MENQNKQITLNDLKITISLEEYFNISYYRRLSNIVIVSEERYNALACQEGFNELVHSDSFVSETGKTLYRMERKENLVKTSLDKDKERLQEKVVSDYEFSEAKKKHEIIEKWKKDSLFKMMKKGFTKEQAVNFITRAMNPSSAKDKSIADKLGYPYREENEEVKNA